MRARSNGVGTSIVECERALEGILPVVDASSIPAQRAAAANADTRPRAMREPRSRRSDFERTSLVTGASERFDEIRRGQQKPRLADAAELRDALDSLERSDRLLGSALPEREEAEGGESVRGGAAQAELDVARKRTLRERPALVGVTAGAVHAGEDTRGGGGLGGLLRLLEQLECLRRQRRSPHPSGRCGTPAPLAAGATGAGRAGSPPPAEPRSPDPSPRAPARTPRARSSGQAMPSVCACPCGVRAAAAAAARAASRAPRLPATVRLMLSADEVDDVVLAGGSSASARSTSSTAARASRR